MAVGPNVMIADTNVEAMDCDSPKPRWVRAGRPWNAATNSTPTAHMNCAHASHVTTANDLMSQVQSDPYRPVTVSDTADHELGNEVGNG